MTESQIFTPLTFKEYHEKHRTPLTVIAARTGLSSYQVYRLMRRDSTSVKVAVTIEKYTKGEVSCEKMLPEKMLKEIEEAKNKEYP